MKKSKLGSRPPFVVWETRLQELKEFKAEHGHCKVPRKLGSLLLHRWLYEQRTRLNRVFPKHNWRMPQQREKLEAVLETNLDQWGEQHSPKPWDRRLEELKEFKEKHGHCQVPQFDESLQALYNWLYRQRHMSLNPESPHCIRNEFERKRRRKALESVLGESAALTFFHSQQSPQSVKHELEREQRIFEKTRKRAFILPREDPSYRRPRVASQMPVLRPSVIGTHLEDRKSIRRDILPPKSSKDDPTFSSPYAQSPMLAPRPSVGERQTKVRTSIRGDFLWIPKDNLTFSNPYGQSTMQASRPSVDKTHIEAPKRGRDHVVPKEDPIYRHPHIPQSIQNRRPSVDEAYLEVQKSVRGDLLPRENPIFRSRYAQSSSRVSRPSVVETHLEAKELLRDDARPREDPLYRRLRIAMQVNHPEAAGTHREMNKRVHRDVRSREDPSYRNPYAEVQQQPRVERNLAEDFRLAAEDALPGKDPSPKFPRVPSSIQIQHHLGPAVGGPRSSPHVDPSHPSNDIEYVGLKSPKRQKVEIAYKELLRPKVSPTETTVSPKRTATRQTTPQRRPINVYGSKVAPSGPFLGW